MIGNGNIFSGGKKSSRNKLNRLRSDTTAAGNMRGDNLIHVMSNNNGYSFTFDVQKLISLLPLRIGGSGGTSLLKAYCKEDAGASNSITCFLSYPELNVRNWLATTTFNEFNVAIYDNKYWASKGDTNLNHVPAEDAYWTEIKEYDGTVTYNITEADKMYMLFNSKLWRSLQAANLNKPPTEGSWWSTKAEAYSGAKAYKVEDRVASSSKVYRCIQDGTGKTPATETAYWTELEEIEVYCDIAGGNSLQLAFPLLAEQVPLRITSNSTLGRYEAIQLFQAAEEECAEGGMLELVNQMLTMDSENDSNTDWETCGYYGLGLSFAAQADSTYIIEFTIIYTGEDTGTAIVLGVDGPSGKISVSGVFYGHDHTSTPYAMTGKSFNDYYNAADSHGVVAFVDSAPGMNFIRGECVFQNGSTAGEFSLKFRSSDSGKLVTIKIGSNIKYRRVYRKPTIDES